MLIECIQQLISFASRHVLKLSEFMHRLADCFIRRVYRERHKRAVWGYVPPRHHCLSDQE
jgi:hypothetical protein